ISKQPESQTVGLGSNVVFTVTATGSPPLSFQWFRDGRPLLGATKASLSLFNATQDDKGVYTVQVSNQLGSVLSSDATLAIVVYSSILADNFDPTINPGSWTSFGGTSVATNYGGYQSAPNSLWFGGDGSRFAQASAVDTSSGGFIEFFLRYGSGLGGFWDTAELPAKAVVLEFLTASGTNWVE